MATLEEPKVYSETFFFTFSGLYNRFRQNCWWRYRFTEGHGVRWGEREAATEKNATVFTFLFQVLQSVQKSLATASLSDRESIRRVDSDIYLTFPYELGIIMNDDNGRITLRFVHGRVDNVREFLLSSQQAVGGNHDGLPHASRIWTTAKRKRFLPRAPAKKRTILVRKFQVRCLIRVIDWLIDQSLNW
jgi:hypothetical protein